MIQYFIVLVTFLSSLTAGAVLALDVHFTAADGHPLTATLTVADSKTDLKVGVILLPMYRFTRESWLPLVQRLTAAGFTCLSLDLRGHGQSRYGADGSDDEKKVVARDPQFFNSMYLDAAAAGKWLQENEPQLEKLAVVGASVGCSVAVQAITGGHVKAAAAVLMTPGENYLGIATMEQIKDWPGIPLLLLSSEEEQERGAAAINRQLHNRGAELKLFPQTGVHGTRMFGQIAGVEELITGWLALKTIGR